MTDKQGTSTIVATNPEKPLSTIQTDTKRKVGRPRTCTPELIEAMVQESIDRPGATIAMLAEAANCSIASIYSWSDPKSPVFSGDFLEALARARQRSRAAIESAGLAGMHDAKFNHSVWKFWAINRLGDGPDAWKPEAQLGLGNAVQVVVNLGSQGESDLL